MRLTCPWCGERDVEEFTFGGDAAARRPEMDDDDPEAWTAYLYDRDNPRGRHLEYWHHERGCRSWLLVERDTQSHRVLSARLCDGSEP